MPTYVVCIVPYKYILYIIETFLSIDYIVFHIYDLNMLYGCNIMCGKGTIFL
jgi:hypothetical protein